MGRPLIFFLSGVTVLLLAQALWLSQTGGALGQDVENRPPVAATPMNAACAPELQQFCSGVQPGQGRLIQCLNGRRSDLSEACRTFVQLAQQGCAPEVGRTVRCIKPSDTDSAIKRYDRMHYVLFNEKTGPGANLLVFLTGTGGRPPGPLPFLHAAADAGYRVISLDYNDEPAVAVFCPPKPPTCSGNFRRMRIYGDGISLDPSFDNAAAESIVNRLVKLLAYLDRQDPQQGWGSYLDNGAPSWERIAFAGQSQGAGMAAYIAKGHAVARAILFSSPWDFARSNGNVRTLAPWIATPSKTPPDRWFGAYHAREVEAGLLSKSYAELRIPPENTRVFNRDLPASHPQSADKNPYHGESLTNPLYAEDRAFFLGRSP
jgi:predicted esterase